MKKMETTNWIQIGLAFHQKDAAFQTMLQVWLEFRQLKIGY